VTLPAGEARARVVYSEEDLPTQSSGHQHVFLELSDYLGSTAFIIDRATSELVEHSTYMPYGGAESDYRPGRWGSFREPYKFSGKEEDVEVGLQYFGARAHREIELPNPCGPGIARQQPNPCGPGIARQQGPGGQAR
jgi:hypothetical protein